MPSRTSSPPGQASIEPSKAALPSKTTSLSNGTEPHSSKEPSAPFEIKPSPGRGLGVFATRRLEPGTLILAEKPLMQIPNAHYMAADLDEIFATLPDEVKAKVMNLASAHGQDARLWPSLPRPPPSPETTTTNGNASSLPSASGETPSIPPPKIHPSVPPHERSRIAEQHAARLSPSPSLLSIVTTNAMACGKGAAIFDLASRFNHSCVPNAVFQWDPREGVETVYAVQPVEAGEEVTVSYVNPYLSEEMRGFELRNWGFRCGCAACADGGFRGASRQRRWRLRELDEETHRAGDEGGLIASYLEEVALLLEEGLVIPTLGGLYLEIARVCSKHGDNAMAVLAAEKSHYYYTICIGPKAELTTVTEKAVRAFKKDLAAERGTKKGALWL